MQKREPCRCLDPVRNALPEDIRESVAHGEHHAVRAWLYKGGDVNASTQAGDTLLYTAIINNKTKVLQELLKFPTLHLNTRHNSGINKCHTPLWLAAAKGHVTCVRALLNASIECTLDLIASKGGELSALMVAADNSQWPVVRTLLEAKEMNSKEAVFIFSKAAEEMQWDVVLSGVSQYKQLNADILNPLLVKAYEEGEWLVVISMLKTNFRYKRESLNTILLKTAKERHWEKVTKLLVIMGQPKGFDMELVEAAISENAEAVKTNLDVKNYDDETANSNLIVIAACGTSEQIAWNIFRNRYYSGEAQENVLLLSSLNGHLEFLQEMFSRKSGHKFTYQSLSRAQHTASKAGHTYVEQILEKVLQTTLENFSYNY